MSSRGIDKKDDANFTPVLGEYKDLHPFRLWCQKVLPLVYDDSLSYYELLCKVIDYLNKTMKDVETLYGDVTNLHEAYVKLQNYVNNYFSTLDVQQEINNKLDEMAKTGELAELFNKYALILNNTNVFPLAMFGISFYLPERNSLLVYSNDGENFDVMCELTDVSSKSGNAVLWYNNGVWYKFDYSDAGIPGPNTSLKYSTSKDLFNWSNKYYKLPFNYESEFTNPNSIFMHNNKLYYCFCAENPNASIKNPLGFGFTNYVIEILNFNSDMSITFGVPIELNISETQCVIDAFIGEANNTLYMLYRNDVTDGLLYWVELNDDFSLKNEASILSGFNSYDKKFEAPSFIHINNKFYVYADNFGSNPIKTPGGGVCVCVGQDFNNLSSPKSISNSSFAMRAFIPMQICKLEQNAITSLLALKKTKNFTMVNVGSSYVKDNERGNKTITAKKNCIVVLTNNFTVDEIDLFQLDNGEHFYISVAKPNTVKFIRGININMPYYTNGFYISHQNCEQIYSITKIGDKAAFSCIPEAEFYISQKEQELNVNVIHENNYTLHITGASQTSKTTKRLINTYIHVIKDTVQITNNGDVSISCTINNIDLNNDIITITMPFTYNTINIKGEKNCSFH